MGTKTPGPNDKRACMVRRPDAVEDAYSKAYEIVATHAADVLRRLSADESALLTSHLTKLREEHKQ